MSIKRGQMWKADQNTDNTGKDSFTGPEHSEQPLLSCRCGIQPNFFSKSVYFIQSFPLKASGHG